MRGTIDLADSVKRIIDGDTAEIAIALALKTHRTENCRLAGINTPELNSTNLEERAKAFLAKEYLEMTILKEWVWCHLSGQDKYGRPLVMIQLESGIIVNSEILKLGLGTRMAIAKQFDRDLRGEFTEEQEQTLRLDCLNILVNMKKQIYSRHGIYIEKDIDSWS
jgi:endonuclease YncB( thermonuclease family)